MNYNSYVPCNNPYGQFNNYQSNYQNSYQGYQSQYPINNQILQPLSQVNSQNNTLSGWYVDGYDVTKSINADMAGNAMFFPSTDGKEIYKKQLDINTGKSTTYTYKLEDAVNQNTTEVDFSPIYSKFNELKDEIASQISEIKDMVLDSITTPNKIGGGKK